MSLSTKFKLMMKSLSVISKSMIILCSKYRFKQIIWKILNVLWRSKYILMLDRTFRYLRSVTFLLAGKILMFVCRPNVVYFLIFFISAQKTSVFLSLSKHRQCCDCSQNLSYFILLFYSSPSPTIVFKFLFTHKNFLMSTQTVAV